MTITSSNPQPGLGNATAIDAPLTATSGTGSANLTWDEVGTIDLNASLSAYLGSALSISGAQAGVGRFRPANFDTTVALTTTVPMPCPNGVVCPAAFNGFVYSGQPFSVQVFARSLAGNTTANYAGTFAYATTLTAWDALGSTTTPNPGPGALANNAVAAATFAAGVATVATPTYTFAAATAPTNIFVRATDTDGVTSLRAVPATSVEGGVAVASGRIKLSNAHGSELLPLPLTATVQYFNGASWLTSATDDVTSFNTNLSADGGNLVATIVTGLAGGVAVAVPGAAPVVDGIRTFRLVQPGQAGSVNLTIDAPAYLSSNTARATFGVYKGNNEFIYLRENY
jgi:MSHA biogenesis protein MshQ